MPDLKPDVRCYVACCPLCEKFLWLNRTLRALSDKKQIGATDDSYAMVIVEGNYLLLVTPLKLYPY